MTQLAEQVQGERAARMVLSMIADPNDAPTGRVLARVGGVETLRLIDDVQASVPWMNRADGIAWRDRMATRIPDDLPDRLVQAEASGIVALMPADEHWPQSLNDLGARAPFVLWARGATSMLTGDVQDRVTVTGSRAATSYGMTATGEIADDLARREHVIVAGGAYGVEGEAHRAALAAGGSTVAVMAGGVDRLYPSGHAEMLGRIGDLGTLVSEAPPGAEPTRQRFIARTRLMAALSGTTVLTEAGIRSMAVLVPVEARNLDRGTGAVPGPVTSAASTGANELLKRGIAEVVTDAKDVRELMGHVEESDPGRSGLLDRTITPSTPSPQEQARSL